MASLTTPNACYPSVQTVPRWVPAKLITCDTCGNGSRVKVRKNATYEWAATLECCASVWYICIACATSRQMTKYRVHRQMNDHDKAFHRATSEKTVTKSQNEEPDPKSDLFTPTDENRKEATTNVSVVIQDKTWSPDESLDLVDCENNKRSPDDFSDPTALQEPSKKPKVSDSNDTKNRPSSILIPKNVKTGHSQNRILLHCLRRAKNSITCITVQKEEDLDPLLPGRFGVTQTQLTKSIHVMRSFTQNWCICFLESPELRLFKFQKSLQRQ